MKPFNTFFEKRERNPLRKQELSLFGNVDYNSPKFRQDWIDYITTSDVEDLESEDDKVIRSTYDYLSEVYPEKALRFISNEFNSYLKGLQKPSKQGYEQVFEYMGVKVAVDGDTVDGDFSENSYNMRILKSVISKFVFYIKDLLPNRKPTFIITNLTKNPDTKKHSTEKTGGLYFSDTIFIDFKRMDDEELYVHEYAHHLADQIPNQTEVLLKKAYQDMIDMYYKSMKKGKGKDITPTIRANMSKKLGFPEYGLLNSDEFFAVVIQYWKQFPNNKLTYKFKSLVKKVLTRL